MDILTKQLADFRNKLRAELKKESLLVAQKENLRNELKKVECAALNQDKKQNALARAQDVFTSAHNIKQLWQAVLGQAVQNACGSGDERDESGNSRELTRDWLLKDNTDLREVCDAAEINAHDVMDRARSLENQNWTYK